MMLSRLFQSKIGFMDEAKMIVGSTLGHEVSDLPEAGFRTGSDDFCATIDGVRIGFHGLDPAKRLLRLSVFPFVPLPRLYPDRVQSAMVDLVLLSFQEVVDGRLVRVSQPYGEDASGECVMWERDLVSVDASHLESMLGGLLLDLPGRLGEVETELREGLEELEQDMAAEAEVQA